jgi:predicted PurR-regulated permease PerM
VRRPEPPGPGREGPSTRTIVRVVGTVLGIAVFLWLLWVSRNVVLWVAVAALLATAINPAVNLFQRRGRMPRPIAIFVVYLIGLGIAAGVAYVLVPPLIDAGQDLAANVPGYVDQLSQSQLVRQLDEDYDVLTRVEDGLTNTLTDVAGPDTAVEITQTVLNGIIALVSIAVICFLLSLYGPRTRAWFMGQLEDEAHDRAERILDRCYQVVAGYVVGTICVATIGALAVFIFLTIVDVPFAPLLVFWVFIATFIPYVGATLGGIPYVAVAFFEGWPVGVAALAFLLVYQQFENNVIQPFVHRHTVRLNALWILLAVLIGTQVLGIVGALVAIPLAGILQVLIGEWWAARRGVEPPPPP